MARKKEITLDRILDAAEEIIVETGGRHFTLDAVAERASVSKGGLVYSFATKDDLIAAALNREMKRFRAAVTRRAEQQDTNGQQQLISYVDEVMGEDEALIRKASFLMTALVHAPEAIEPARALYQWLFELFDVSTAQGRDARQAVLAVEGLFLLRGTGLIDASNEQWVSVLEHARETLLKALSHSEVERKL
jgi:AcrR family transcriptional regulator